MSGPKTPRIWYDEAANAYVVATPYDPDFVSWFKATIPSRDRTYDPERKVWLFAEGYKDKVKDTVESTFGFCEFTERVTPVVDVATDCFAEFAKLVGQDSLSRAYRHAAAKFHPDHGGSAERMAKLSALWANIQKAL